MVWSSPAQGNRPYAPRTGQAVCIVVTPDPKSGVLYPSSFQSLAHSFENGNSATLVLSKGPALFVQNTWGRYLPPHLPFVFKGFGTLVLFAPRSLFEGSNFGGGSDLRGIRPVGIRGPRLSFSCSLAHYCVFRCFLLPFAVADFTWFGLFSISFVSSNFFVFTFIHTLRHIVILQLPSLQILPNSFTKTRGVGYTRSKPISLPLSARRDVDSAARGPESLAPPRNIARRKFT
jgi:hypothetical protein